ncbi:hypothetical protein JAAARDRAFT_37360 [Jaapia argillacea MUCL 33604]|uniref:Uncharacterized protein n=1 Tax=Jaapia argillacea MUCL 33604 TaxID=933084 RepID=A0A067PVN9_9AGAM|nr:hypothetical protein JAAARDRAFT_37360 [Jaapia argillacea MUCL 33604]
MFPWCHPATSSPHLIESSEKSALPVLCRAQAPLPSRPSASDLKTPTPPFHVELVDIASPSSLPLVFHLSDSLHPW